MALRCTSVAIAPTAPSVFGTLKREPSRAAVSTLEAVAMALGAMMHGDEQRILPVRRRRLGPASEPPGR